MSKKNILIYFLPKVKVPFKVFPKTLSKTFTLGKIPTVDKTNVDRFSVNEFLHQLYWRFKPVLFENYFEFNVCGNLFSIYFPFVFISVIAINFNLFLILFSIIISCLLFAVLCWILFVFFSNFFLSPGIEVWIYAAWIYDVWIYDVKINFCQIC